MFFKGYDAWKLATPYDDEPKLCECGVEDCTCAEDAEYERADALHHAMRDRENER